MSALFFFLVGFSVAASLYMIANQKLINTIETISTTLQGISESLNQSSNETQTCIRDLTNSLMNLRI